MKDAIKKILNETTCGHCEYDEAEGLLINHCDKCCRKIIRQIFELLEAQPEDSADSKPYRRGLWWFCGECNSEYATRRAAEKCCG